MTARRSSGGGRSRDRGSVTVLLLAVVAVALTFAVGLVALVRAADARGTAQTAADLAALSGADVAARPGGPDPCAVAATVVAWNGAVLSRCAELPGGFVEVAASVTARPLPGWSVVAAAHARAGPVR